VRPISSPVQAHRLQRRRPLRGLLVPMATIFDLLQMSPGLWRLLLSYVG
jgi:hypothetical protein